MIGKRRNHDDSGGRIDKISSRIRVVIRNSSGWTIGTERFDLVEDGMHLEAYAVGPDMYSV